MRHDRRLEELWSTAAPSEHVFDPNSVSSLPPVAQRYLRHALAPGAKLSTCARLSMTGTIKLKPGWCKFEAEQLLRWDRGFVWAATAKVNGLPVTGFDRLVDGVGAMRWKLLGLFPVMKADGAEIARAAAGRLHAEAIWLPAALLETEVSWVDRGSDHTVAIFDAHGEHSELDLEISPAGALLSCCLSRWGDKNTGVFAYHPFGGAAEQEQTFAGVTIPIRLRVGWLFGTPAFDSEGEFFRCTLHSVQYR
ncbi:hypothetical protein KQ299_04800 [Synechococcus sp. CS-603]|nr:hypothetical protein [Synechococcus sp. CS-603]